MGSRHHWSPSKTGGKEGKLTLAQKKELLAAKLDDDAPSPAEQNKLAYGAWYLKVGRWKARPKHVELKSKKEEDGAKEQARAKAEEKAILTDKLKKSVGLKMYLGYLGNDGESETPTFLQAVKK